MMGVETFAKIFVAGSTQAVWLAFVFFSIGSRFYKGRLIPVLLVISSMRSMSFLESFTLEGTF
jgi:hypothetical protein